ncbi:MAG: penicillin acylase family protein [Gemmatimonadaceae bacterium]|nr:penicillin acylase family protein [Gemmatimonadaceae bacterium]
MLRRAAFLVSLIPALLTAQPTAAARAARVTITRDDWGIAHVHGPTDSDAVFGMIYAQAEDDFPRIEANYLSALGRLAEAEGERALWRDLRMRLFINPDTLRVLYARAPQEMRTLMDAWAEGLNYFLATHPTVRPRVLTRFEPWMALAFSEGSISGDIEKVALGPLQRFYAPQAATPRDDEDAFVDGLPREPGGSNGIAIAPQNTRDGHALLLINPHTSFHFRSELQMTSDEGLNAYGAATWGQFFIYQGFNARVGWMHTTSGVDAVDEYAESIVGAEEDRRYRYGSGTRPFGRETITLRYKDGTGFATRTITVFRSHHGPIIREQDGKWIAIRIMQEPVKALTQSFTRTKARDLAAFRTSMEFHTNSSNNTIYADADGRIVFFHANFVPKRDTRFDWSRPVDGSDPATEWGPVHGVTESPYLQDPATGFIQNTNNWPYSAAGSASQKADAFAAYFDNAGENPRGIHALRVLEGRRDFTLESLRAAAYDSYLPAFADLIPTLLAAWDAAPDSSALRAQVAPAIARLRAWDFRWGAGSVPTTLAVFWGEEMWRRVRADAESEEMKVYDYIRTRTAPTLRLQALAAAMQAIATDFGRWDTPWGEVNRFQRLTGDIVQPFADTGRSIAVPFTSSQWGSLASFGAQRYPGTKRRYGTSGNSFVAVVEFGPRVRAIAVSAGGEHNDPANAHFNDQAQRYADGALREVYFYPEQLQGHSQRRYRPGP